MVRIALRHSESDGHFKPGADVLLLCQRSFEALNRSGRDVRAPGTWASRPLTIPQFIPERALVPIGE
jgi:hypothetical protein